METSILTSKGQLLIPKRLRNKYGIKAGIKVAFIESTEGLLLKAMDENFFNQFVGLLKDETTSVKESKSVKNGGKVRENQSIDIKTNEKNRI
jgi:AbrB family looped-hinge helix DNA binding protein